jgi:hypothetical protein
VAVACLRIGRVVDHDNRRAPRSTAIVSASSGCYRCAAGCRRCIIVVRVNDDNVRVVGEASCWDDAAVLASAWRGNATGGSGARPRSEYLLQGALKACGLDGSNLVFLIALEVEVVQHSIIAFATASGSCASRRRNDVHVGGRRSGRRGEARGHDCAHDLVFLLITPHHGARTAHKRLRSRRRGGR